MQYVALLRGINVGGKHKLPMKELVQLCEDAGCSEVRTYIQSGNVLLEAPAALAKRLPEDLAARIEERFGFAVPVVMRKVTELAQVAANNPFLGKRGVDPAHLAVAFLGKKPTAKAVASLEPDRSPGDAFEVVGREVYLHMPNGVARTKLTNAWMDSRLGTVSTARNLKTISKLLELAGD